MLKFFAIFVACAAVCAAQLPEGIDWHHGAFVTNVDHFRPLDVRQVHLNYSINLEFWTGDGPVVIFLNDATEFDITFIQQGLMYDIASQTNAALVTYDHRFFGNNEPTPDSSFENLQFLTVDQMAADIPHLVHELRAQLALTSESRVILWGTGHGGTLSVIARKKYPHLIDGVWSSSGLFRAVVADESYFENLSQNIRFFGSVFCSELLESAFNQIEELIENGDGATIQETFNLCSPLDTENPQEIGTFYYILIQQIAQFLNSEGVFGYNNLCRDIGVIADDPLASLVRWQRFYYGSDQCTLSSYPELIAGLQETNWDHEFLRLRLGFYLQCTQIGSFETTASIEMEIFPDRLTIEVYQQLCEDIFGETYNFGALANAVEELNIKFGGQTQVITHVVFSNADLDPWINHGIAEYDEHESGVVSLRYTGPGSDLTSIDLSEPQSTTEAKREITRFVTGWITIDPRN